jgi:hypothetical protein
MSWRKLDIHLQENKTRFQFLIFTSINSKWIEDLNVISEMVKLLHDKTGSTLYHIGIGSNFMNRTLITQQLRERTDKWDCMKLKSFCTAKETVIRLKIQLQNGRKIFDSYSSDKGLITRIYRELKNRTTQGINNPLNKLASELSRQFSKDVQTSGKYMKNCSTFLP